MKHTLPILLFSCAVTPHMAQAQTKHAAERPNIILFLVDDMGWQDTSLPFWKEKTYNNTIYETPNMERLAQKGMKFTQAYASSISSPSRISLYTGMNSARHRVTNWTLERNKSRDSADSLLIFPEWNVNGFCQETTIERCAAATSMAQVLKDNGYYTIHCGKAHFGAVTTPGENPLNLGFDINIAGHAGGAPASYLGTDNFGNRTDGKPSPEFAVPGLNKYYGKDVFLTNILTQEALKAIDNRTPDKPFFLYMSHYAIHLPHSRDKRFYQKYRDKGLNEREAAYAALIEGMDKSLGDIMDYLEQKNLEDNTIVLFLSDNGGYALEDLWGKRTYQQNYPLQHGKGSAYEGGIREPMIVYWPNVTRPQSVCDDYLIIEDFYPSILEMAGIHKYKTLQQIDGKSFIPFLTGKGNPAKGRKLFWNFPNGWGSGHPGYGATCTVRDGDWKLIYYYATGKKELFNITNDISEKNNLAGKYPQKVKKMSKDLGTYLRKVNAQRPSFKKTGKETPWPDQL